MHPCHYAVRATRECADTESSLPHFPWCARPWHRTTPQAGICRAAIPRVGAPLSGAENWIYFQAWRTNFRAEARKEIWGVFRVSGVRFRVLGGVLVFWGVFSRCAAVFFARSARGRQKIFQPTWCYALMMMMNQTQTRPRRASSKRHSSARPDQNPREMASRQSGPGGPWPTGARWRVHVVLCFPAGTPWYCTVHRFRRHG